MVVSKKLIVAVEGTAAIGPFWQTIVSDYLDKIVRCLCGNVPTGKKPSASHVELSLVMFSTHGSYSACLVQRSGWTKDVDVFFHWLSSIPFSGGGFNDAAIAEGLAEALMMFSSPNGNRNKNVEVERHCILVAASNPYPLPTMVYRPQFQNPENIETRLDNCLCDAETLAKCFAQCAISLSIICPRQLPKLRGIYNAGKRDPQAEDSPVVNLKNPHFLVLISDNFTEARSSLSGPKLISFPSNQNPVEMDVTRVLPISSPGLRSLPSNQNSVEMDVTPVHPIPGPGLTSLPSNEKPVEMDVTQLVNPIPGPGPTSLPSNYNPVEMDVTQPVHPIPGPGLTSLPSNHNPVKMDVAQPVHPIPGPGLTTLPSYHNPVEMDVKPVPPIPGPGLTSLPSYHNPVEMDVKPVLPIPGPGLTSLPSNHNPVEMNVTTVLPIPGSVPPIPGPHPSSALSDSANGPGLAPQPMSVETILPVTVKQELTTLTGPTIPNISSVLHAASQHVPSLQTSSPISTSEDKRLPDIKPSVLRPVSVAAPNVRILNDVAQARQGLVTVPNIGSLPVSVTGQNAQDPTVGSFTNTGSNIPGTRMVQTGMSMNPSMMSGAAQQGQPAAGMVPAGVISNNTVLSKTLNQQVSSTTQSGQSKYIKIWEGSLSGQRQGQPVFITNMEAYRTASASDSLAANWPSVMQIVRLISQEHMHKREYTTKVDYLVFRALNQHGFLAQLQDKKLCAVVQLPSQTLLLSVSDKAQRLIAMLLHGDKIVVKPRIPNQPMQLQQQNEQQPIKTEHIAGVNQQEVYVQGIGTGQSQQGQVSSQGQTTTVSGGPFTS